MDEPYSPAPYRVEQQAFSGTLAELLTELRSGRLQASQLDLLSLVRDWLAYFRAFSSRDLDTASESLPQMAQVLELKLRLLLPRTTPETEEELLTEAVDTVSELADLENAITYLKNRREDRRLLLSARAELSGRLARRKRPQPVRPGALAQLAGRLRSASYFEVISDSFGFREALGHLRNLLRGRRQLSFREAAAGLAWPQVTVLFATVLELVRDGTTRAVQAEPFGDISLSPVRDAEAGEN